MASIDSVEVLPHPSIRDPLMCQLGLSLKSELESPVVDAGAIAMNTLVMNSQESDKNREKLIYPGFYSFLC